MLDMGVIEQSGDSLKPYTIIKTETELKEILNSYSWAVTSMNTVNLSCDQNLHGIGDESLPPHSHVNKESYDKNLQSQEVDGRHASNGI